MPNIAALLQLPPVSLLSRLQGSRSVPHQHFTISRRSNTQQHEKLSEDEQYLYNY